MGAGGTPALLPQHPPTHCPAAGANGWTDKQQLLPERRCPCALQNVTATLPSTCGVQLQWGKGWGRTTQLRSCRGCSAAASRPPAPLYGKNQLLLRIRGAEPHCTLKPFSGSPREDAILYSSISKNSLSGNFWVLEPASGTKPVLSCQGMGGGLIKTTGMAAGIEGWAVLFYTAVLQYLEKHPGQLEGKRPINAVDQGSWREVEQTL